MQSWDRSADIKKRKAVLEALTKEDLVTTVDGVQDESGRAIDAIIGPTGRLSITS